MTENVNHPAHYGGEDNPYEVIKVAEAWGFDKNAYLFNVLKYIARPGKGRTLEDLKKARWYLNRLIDRLEGVQEFPLDAEEKLKASIERLESQSRHPAGKVHTTPAEPYKFPEPVNLPTCNGCLGTSGNHSCGEASEWKTEYTKWSGRPE